MHVYLPMTLTTLAEAVRSGVIGPAPLDGYAVTTGLRSSLEGEDEEELEYAAQNRAAATSLTRLAGDPGAPRRRVVVAVDVDESTVEDPDGLETGAVVLRSELPWARVVSAHVDDPVAGDDLARALADPSDTEAASDVDQHQLLWFAVQELPELLAGS